MHSGKVAAPTPMVVPTTLRVSGPIAVMKMMKGIGRTMFTTTLSTVLTARWASRPPRRVAYSTMPSTSPRAPPTIRVTAAMNRVCQIASR